MKGCCRSILFKKCKLIKINLFVSIMPDRIINLHGCALEVEPCTLMCWAHVIITSPVAILVLFVFKRSKPMKTHTNIYIYF